MNTSPPLPTGGEIPDPKYGAPALDKGLDILELLSAVGLPQSQKEIAQALGRNPSETYRMLAVLEGRRYLVRDGASGKYSLSLRLFHLAHTHSPWDFVRRTAQLPLQDLAVEARQSCHIGVMHEDRLLILTRARSPVPVALSVEEGSQMPLLETASGKLLLGMLPVSTRLEILSRLPQYTELTAAARRTLEDQLSAIGSERHLIAPSDYTLGVTDISVPIGAPSGPIQAALTLPCLSTTLAGHRDDAHLLQLARTCAERITDALGLKL